MRPILFSLGPLSIYSFGVFLFLALFIGAFYAWRKARHEFEEELLLDSLVVITIFAILGARLFYVFSHFANFNFDLLRWIHFYLYPGFSFWGGVIGGLLGAIWFAGKKKVLFWRLADFLVLGAAVGQIFGQIGCFLNSCTVGLITTLPWGMPAIGFLGGRHPVALYDALTAFLILLVVVAVHRWIFIQRRQREGSALLAYLTILAFFSFLLEFLRESELYFYNLSLNQWMALFFFLGAGSLGYWRLHKTGLNRRKFTEKYDQISRSSSETVKTVS